MADEKVVLTTKEVQDYLQTYVLKNTKLVSPKIHITGGSNEGDNYVGIMYRVTIEGIENDVVKKLELIVKTQRNITQEWGDEIGKKHSGITVRCPLLYHASSESDKELLVFGNLTSEGFVMAKSRILDYPHISLAFRCLGEFHALSFLLRASNPTNFEKIKIKEHIYDKKDSWLVTDQIRLYFETGRDIVLKALADEDKLYTERYQRFANNLDKEMFDAIDAKQAEPYTVVIHGDLWTNNLLFKYDKNEIPYDMRFLDFQEVRYVSPVIDVVHLFFTCCAPEIRSKYYDQLIREYHDALSKYLKSFGYNPDDLFPYKILYQHLKKFGKYAAGMATILIPILFNDGDDKSVQNLFSQETLEEKLKTNSTFRNCVKSSIKDLVDKNYI